MNSVPLADWHTHPMKLFAELGILSLSAIKTKFHWEKHLFTQLIVYITQYHTFCYMASYLNSLYTNEHGYLTQNSF